MRKGQPFRQSVARATIPGPETSLWYWNPNRVGASPAPTWFMEKVKDVDPDGFIDIRWNPIAQRWGVFYRKPSFSHKLCNGWMLLFPVQYSDGSYMPLDERLLARLYSASGAKWGNGKRYFDAIQREMEREQEREEKRAQNELIDNAMPYFEHSQIKVSGFGPSSGSKFQKYHSGM